MNARLSKLTPHLAQLVVALALSLAALQPAAAHRGNTAASEASALSMLPVAVSVAVPVGLVLSAGAYTMVAVTAVSEGTAWVLERASDGAQVSVTFSGGVLTGVSVASGMAVTSVAVSTGWVLSTAGRAIAFIPNEIGKALLHHERVTR